MARAKTKTSGASWFWHYNVLTLVLLIVVAIVGYLGYAHVQVANNKRDFQQARATINSIYADIVRTVGKPDNTGENDSCSRRYQELSGYTDLHCSVITDFIYPAINESDANSLLASIQKVIDTSGAFSRSKSIENTLNDSLVGNDLYHTAHNYYDFMDLKCEISYVYDTSRQTNLIIKDLSKKPFEVFIDCTGPAKKQYYQLAY